MQIEKLKQFFSRSKADPYQLMPFLPISGFLVPILWLYFLEPTSFELLWKGRTFELIFIWLIALELILSWEILQKNKLKKVKSAKGVLLIFSLTLPTVYILASFYGGLNTAITNWAAQNDISWDSSMPLSIEYLAFTIMFCVITLLTHGKKGLKTLAIPALFMGLVGFIYTIDNVFPYGQFTPFQLFVPTTAFLAAQLLNIMGYTTILGNTALEMPTLQVTGAEGTAKFAIAWPCAGIESLLIFTVVVLLFLKRLPISWKAKAGFFIFGAMVTYFINIFRIVNIFLIGMTHGSNSHEVQMFHFYHGPLYAITWIVLYPLIIILALSLWQKHKKTKKVDLALGNLNLHS
jgi:thaumarchaeosortase